MKIVFLDVDGVLNHSTTKETFNNYVGIDAENLAVFGDFMRTVGQSDDVRIVLSSSWRKGVNREGNVLPDGYKYLLEQLESVQLSIYDVTPVLPSDDWYENRGTEILKWLKEHKDLGIDGYVVLDDEYYPDFMTTGVSKHWIRTSWDDPKGGFRDKHKRYALRLIQKPCHL